MAVNVGINALHVLATACNFLVEQHNKARLGSS